MTTKTTTKYKQLCRDQRVSISTLHNLGVSMRQIALAVGLTLGL